MYGQILMTSFKRSLILLILLRIYPVFCTDSSLDHASFSVYAVHCDNGKVLLAENCDLSLTPASCMKIITTATALQILGVNKRFETRLEYDGFIDETKTLQGNVYIRGGGDPCLGSDRIPGNPSWKKQVDRWADAIQKLGILKIKGRVIGDGTRWETALAVPSWAWEDLGNYYGAGACALSFHENLYTISFKPADKVGEPANILHTDPPLLPINFHNELKTGPEKSGDCACIYGSEFSSTQFIRGTIPLGVDEFAIKGAIPDPTRFCADLLSNELKKRALIIEGKNTPSYCKRTHVHTTYSPTIGEIVHWTNQKSINLYAEHLLKKIGEELNKDGSTISGIKAITDFWNAQSINLQGFNMADGSGLSRKNLVTTRQFVEILLKMKKSNLFPVFLESLPQKEGALRAKSGSMSLIRGYVGYAGNIAFAILVNQCVNSQAMQEKMNSLLLQIRQFNQDEDSF